MEEEAAKVPASVLRIPTVSRANADVQRNGQNFVFRRPCSRSRANRVQLQEIPWKSCLLQYATQLRDANLQKAPKLTSQVLHRGNSKQNVADVAVPDGWLLMLREMRG